MNYLLLHSSSEAHAIQNGTRFPMNSCESLSRKLCVNLLYLSKFTNQKGICESQYKGIPPRRTYEVRAIKYISIKDVTRRGQIIPERLTLEERKVVCLGRRGDRNANADKFENIMGAEPLFQESNPWQLPEPQVGISNPPEKRKLTTVNVGVKLFTLAIVQRKDQILLGRKKRGFGTGHYFGFGGKVEAGETIEEAAIRELEEECGLRALSLEKRAILTFHFDNKPQPWEVHTYHVSQYEGEPYETSEMAPKWFDVTDIPYEEMWADDYLWLPEFLKGRMLHGEFSFVDDSTMVSHKLRFLEVMS
eukprot:jgi/Mesen1/3433/ME000194S02582